MHHSIPFLFLAALLGLQVNHAVKPEVRTEDEITYTCTVRQQDASTQQAVDIVVEIMIPVTMHFVKDTTTDSQQFKRHDHNENRIDYTVASLALKSEVEFVFKARITDETLTPGLHYASTPIKLRYRSKDGSGRLTSPHEISMVAQVWIKYHLVIICRCCCGSYCPNCPAKKIFVWYV